MTSDGQPSEGGPWVPVEFPALADIPCGRVGCVDRADVAYRYWRGDQEDVVWIAVCDVHTPSLVSDR